MEVIVNILLFLFISLIFLVWCVPIIFRLDDWEKELDDLESKRKEKNND